MWTFDGHRGYPIDPFTTFDTISCLFQKFADKQNNWINNVYINCKLSWELTHLTNLLFVNLVSSHIKLLIGNKLNSFFLKMITYNKLFLAENRACLLEIMEQNYLNVTVQYHGQIPVFFWGPRSVLLHISTI